MYRSYLDSIKPSPYTWAEVKVGQSGDGNHRYAAMLKLQQIRTNDLYRNTR